MSNEEKTLSTTRAIGSLLLIVPSIALLSASYYFKVLTDRVDIVSSGYFTLQDHFDKAVDFIFPVLAVVGVLYVSGYAFVDPKGPFGPLRRWITRRTYLRGKLANILWIWAGVGILYGLPKELSWLSIIPLFGVILPELPRYLGKILGQAFSFDPKEYEAAVAGGLCVAILYFWVVGISAEVATSDNQRKNFTTGNTVIVEKISSGFLVIEDRRYKLLREDGSLILSGEPLERFSKSDLCTLGIKWTCFATLDYELPDY